MTPAQTTQRFVVHINTHDVAAIAALLTPDHRFIDSLGTQVQGREQLREGWRQYLRMVPDYRLEVEHVLADGPQVVLLGRAHGTYTPDGTLASHNAWSTPAAWRARVQDSLIAEWQVYADNEPMRRCMQRAGAQG